MSENFAGGNIPNQNNTERQLLVKILNVLDGGGGGGGSGVSQIVGGSGVTVSPSYGTGVVTLSSSGGTSAPDYINYAGPPVTNPPALQNIVVDVNSRQWQYTPATGWQ